MVLPALGLLTGLLLLPLPDAAAPSGLEVRLAGYAEWRHGQTLVVDGQRLRLAEGGRFHGEGDARAFSSIPLGYEVQARGRRAADGTVLGLEVEARPNGSALFEGRVRAATDEAEAEYRRAGMYFVRNRGRIRSMGRLLTTGPDVERVRDVVGLLVPPYLGPDAVRVYVIENKEWNAFAMGNFSIYVFSGLLRDLDDDELAIVLGHELVHATHEHTRRQFKKQLWVQLAAAGAGAAAGEIDDKKKRALGEVAAGLAVMAWTNGYGRDLEDQADRVGLRYAYEAGYDVLRGPSLWQRFARKYGDKGAVANFFFGNHSRSLARAVNLEREVALNYPEGGKPGGSRNVRHAASEPPEAGGRARPVGVARGPDEGRGGKGAPSGVSAVAAGGAAREVKTGMTAQRVRELLGPPREEVVFEGRTRWSYPECTVILEEGRVKEVRF